MIGCHVPSDVHSESSNNRSNKAVENTMMMAMNAMTNVMNIVPAIIITKKSESLIVYFIHKTKKPQPVRTGVASSTVDQRS
jgi:hypothetical protein